MLFLVDRQPVPPLGLPAGSVAVASSRSSNEKKPWKSLPAQAGIVESDFVRPVHSGETLFPFRMATALEAVLPATTRKLLSDPSEVELYPGLHRWWSEATQCWMDHRSSETLTLSEQLDYQSKLTKQLPMPPLRVVYNRSGMHVVGAKLTDSGAVCNSGLYWMSASTEAEADYLCAILNAPCTTDLVRPLMSYGKDERDIAKHIWDLPIPRYDARIPSHARLSELGAAMGTMVASVPLDDRRHFAAVRRDLRNLLSSSDQGQEANELTFELLA
jgi:hypothetical protein